MDTPQERDFDDLVKLAARICQKPISLVSLVDRDRQWFKGRFGLNISETPRQLSFCTHTIQQIPEILEIPDAKSDPRFADNELVTKEPGFRYYAGAPLVTPDGFALGTLCVLDTKPGRLNPFQKEALQILSRQVMTQLELRRSVAQLGRAASELADAYAVEERRLDGLVNQRTADLGKAVAELKASQEQLLFQHRRLQVLHDSSQLLLAGGDLRLTLNEVFTRVAGHFQTSGFLVFGLDPNTNELYLEHVIAGGDEGCTPGARIQVGEGIAGYVAMIRQPYVANHVQQSADPRAGTVRAYGVSAYACYPLMVEDRLLGTLSFASKERDEFSPEDQRFFQTLTSSIALAKDRIRLLDTLGDHANHLERLVHERTSKLEEMMAELRHLSYRMIHEMRAPLRAMNSFVHLLLRDAGPQLSADAREYLQRIQRAASRMDLLVTQALNFNKILEENPAVTATDPEDVLRDLLATIEEFQPPRAHVRILGPLPCVLASRPLLLRCFAELLRNAVTYVKPGCTPEVDICSEASAGRVRLCFRDNGPGLPEGLHDRIFDLFERGEHGYERGGAGLALVRKMVERMQGKIWAEPRQGEGSTFCVELPESPRTTDSTKYGNSPPP